MKARLVGAVAALELLVLSTPSASTADMRSHARPAGGHVSGSHQAFGAHGPAFRGRGFSHHRFSPRQFRGFGPVIVYAAPPLFAAPGYDVAQGYDPPVSAPPPPVYSAPAYSAPAPVAYSAPPYRQPSPPPPTTPGVVEFPTGRYELRGDGVNSPYTWVWIPNPPPPPTAPPVGAQDGQSARRTPAYEWVDDEGVIHLTNRLDRVPPRYREEISRQPSPS